MSNNNNNNGTELDIVVSDKDDAKSPSSAASTAHGEAEEALELAWSDITIKHGDRKLLHGVSGKVKGRFLAIMGGSGSGKTTLLNFLARRLHHATKQESGESLINEGTYTRSSLKHIAGYVMQDDLLFANLTVEETLMYAAKLRLPATFSKAQLKERVDDSIAKLGLNHTRNTIIGDELRRGVSGGERKRVCVAIELLLHPNVLLLDEPTSGLDSASALSLCQTLKGLASSGSCTVICTVHQPQSKIFNLFDDLIILNKGHVIYRGPRSEVLDFYEAAGLPCPPLTNPADHILDVITFVSGADQKKLDENVRRLRKQLKRKDANKPIISSPSLKKSRGEYETLSEEEGAFSSELEEEDENEDQVNKLTEKAVREWIPDPSPRTPWLRQFAVLTRRCMQETFRSRSLLVAQVLQNIIMAILVGTVFLDIGDGQSSTTRRQPVLFFCVINQGVFGALIVINSFPSERKIVLRERAAGSYFVSAYYMAKIVTDTLLQITSPIVFSCIVYWLVGFQHVAHKFFIFTSFMILCSLAATSVALFVSAICRTTTLAVSILPVALEISRLFGGFFLSPANLPGYFVWLDALSYAKYSYVGISLNELSGLTLKCDVPEAKQASCILNGETTIHTLGLDKLSITTCALVLLLMIVAFRFGAYLAIRYIKY